MNYYCIVCGYRLTHIGESNIGVTLMECPWAGCPRGSLITTTFSEKSNRTDNSGINKNTTRLANAPVTVYNKDWPIEEEVK